MQTRKRETLSERARKKPTRTTFFLSSINEKGAKKEKNTMASSAALPRRRKATRDHAAPAAVVEILCPPERHVSTPFWELVEHAKGDFVLGWLD